jgi:hypothetical protein
MEVGLVTGSASRLPSSGGDDPPARALWRAYHEPDVAIRSIETF